MHNTDVTMVKISTFLFCQTWKRNDSYASEVTTFHFCSPTTTMIITSYSWSYDVNIIIITENNRSCRLQARLLVTIINYESFNVQHKQTCKEMRNESDFW